VPRRPHSMAAFAQGRHAETRHAFNLRKRQGVPWQRKLGEGEELAGQAEEGRVRRGKIREPFTNLEWDRVRKIKTLKQGEGYKYVGHVRQMQHS